MSFSCLYFSFDLFKYPVIHRLAKQAYWSNRVEKNKYNLWQFKQFKLSFSDYTRWFLGLVDLLYIWFNFQSRDYFIWVFVFYLLTTRGDFWDWPTSCMYGLTSMFYLCIFLVFLLKKKKDISLVFIIIWLLTHFQLLKKSSRFSSLCKKIFHIFPRNLEMISPIPDSRKSGKQVIISDFATHFLSYANSTSQIDIYACVPLWSVNCNTRFFYKNNFIRTRGWNLAKT